MVMSRPSSGVEEQRKFSEFCASVPDIRLAQSKPLLPKPKPALKAPTVDDKPKSKINISVPPSFM